MSNKDKKMAMSRADFVIIGFPKCGTSALARLIGTLDDVTLNTMEGLEAPFFSSAAGLDQLTELTSETGIKGHKFSAYIFDEQALKRIQTENPEVLCIICVRDPLRVLQSWREFHRQIADTGKPRHHFTNKTEDSRAFYRSCSLSEYYREFARSRLDHAHRIRWLRGSICNARLAIVHQARLASNQTAVMRSLAALLGTTYSPPENAAAPHVGFADELDEKGIASDVRVELDRFRRDLELLHTELHGDSRVALLW